jgi:hypothetical protein
VRWDVSPNAVSVEDRVGAALAFPVPVDLADEWLADALGFLLEACELPKAALRELSTSPEPAGLFDRAPTPSDDPVARRRRLDAARLAIVLGALAAEARLNRLLKLRDLADWSTFAHLALLEKFGLAPRLLGGVDLVPQHSGLSRLAAELFELRAELVEAGTGPSAALEVADEPDPRFLPAHARAMVEASAKICAFLATVAGRDAEGQTAKMVQRAARAVVGRAEACSIMRGSIAAHREWGWGFEADFPPNVVGS